jgi:hypothetical protein
MKEKDWQVIFNHWLKEVYRSTGAFELKRAVNDVLPFDKVVPHQVQGLLNARHGVLALKLPDSMGLQWPFDCFSLAGVPAYVVIRFSKSFELIDIDTWMLEVKRSKRKSLTYQRACAISTNCIIYKGELANDASLRLGGSKILVSERIRRGWPIKKAFTTPLVSKEQHYSKN